MCSNVLVQRTTMCSFLCYMVKIIACAGLGDTTVGGALECSEWLSNQRCGKNAGGEDILYVRL